MERPLALRPLSIQDENSAIHHKKATIDGKSSKPIVKNGGAKLETRKALNDITNKKSIRVEASAKQTNKKSTVVEDGNLDNHVLGAVSLKKKSSINEKVNIAEEGFLHDHSKCIDAQKATVELNFWDTVLPGHGSADLMVDQTKNDPDIDSFSCILELKELYMSEFSDWFDLRKSPPTSPVRWNSTPESLFQWDLKPVELTLKEEDNRHV